MIGNRPQVAVSLTAEIGNMLTYDAVGGKDEYSVPIHYYCK